MNTDIGLFHRLQDGAPRRGQLVRNRGARLRANAAHQQEQFTDDKNQRIDEEDKNAEFLEGEIGAKKREKLEAKAEKKAQREAEEQLQAENKKNNEQAEEHRQTTEREKSEEKQRKQDARSGREEKERREHEEYLKMKEAFSVEEDGFEEGDFDDKQNILHEFVKMGC